MKADELEAALEDFFSTTVVKNSRLIGLYAELYDLQSIQQIWPITHHQFFSYLKTFVNFVVIALYDRDKKILYTRSETPISSDGIVGYRLLGGPIHDQQQESIEDAVYRIIDQETGMDVVELAPLVMISNAFNCGGEVVSHNGIAFAAMGCGGIDKNIHRSHVFAAEPPENMAFNSEAIFRLAKKRIENKYITQALEQEADAGRRNIIRRAIHRVLFKPLTYWHASKPLRHKVEIRHHEG